MVSECERGEAHQCRAARSGGRAQPLESFADVCLPSTFVPHAGGSSSSSSFMVIRGGNGMIEMRRAALSIRPDVHGHDDVFESECALVLRRVFASA